MPIDIFLIGFGNVGREFVKQFLNYERFLERKHKIKLRIIGLADSSGAILKKNGFTKSELANLLFIPRGYLGELKIANAKGSKRAVDLYSELEAKETVIVEVTPSNYVNGEPAKTHIVEALKKELHVVTANKGPLALYFNEIVDEARKYGVKLRFKATVMAGTPLIDYLTYGYFGREVEKVYGIVNATTNFILNTMFEKEVGFEEALREAQEKGYAEPDPSLDIDGWDSAAKISIISGILGNHIPVNKVSRVTLRSIGLSDVIKAKNKGYVIKYIATYDASGNSAKVEPMYVSRMGSRFAKVFGSENMVIIESDGGLETVIEGPGGGPKPTALTLLSDVALVACEVMGC